MFASDLIVAVPGAFSSACSNQVPGYVEHAEQFAAKGIEGIYVVAVNDVFVMKAWKKDLHAENNPLIHFIADDDANVRTGYM
jgi:peroxiredoxin